MRWDCDAEQANCDVQASSAAGGHPVCTEGVVEVMPQPHVVTYWGQVAEEFDRRAKAAEEGAARAMNQWQRRASQTEANTWARAAEIVRNTVVGPSNPLGRGDAP